MVNNKTLEKVAIEEEVLTEEARIEEPRAEEPRVGDTLDIEWGETKQERIVERTSRSGSARHRCKGRHCETAFDKL